MRQLAQVRHPAQEPARRADPRPVQGQGPPRGEPRLRRTPRPGLPQVGLCKGKAHRAENLGYAGRRVLVSRKWSGKTLADHRASRKAWLMAMLGLPAVDDQRYTWDRVTSADPDHMPAAQCLLHVLADRARWQAALTEARRRAQEMTDNLLAPGRAA